MPPSFLDHFLALFEHVFTGVEDRYVEFSRELNPDAAPREVIDWLAALVDLAFDPSWPVERRRALVDEAMSLYRTRGTIAGIERYVEIYTGIRPAIVEGCWSGRCGRRFSAGREACSAAVCRSSAADRRRRCCPTMSCGRATPIASRSTSTSTMRATPRSRCARSTASSRSTSRRTRCTGRRRSSRTRGWALQSRVGLDLVLGAATAAEAAGRRRRQRRPGQRTKSRPGGVVGVDTVLGARRPQYVRRLDMELGSNVVTNSGGGER